MKQAIVEKARFCATKVASARNRLLKLDPATPAITRFPSAHRLTRLGVWRNDANARVRTIDLFSHISGWKDGKQGESRGNELASLMS